MGIGHDVVEWAPSSYSDFFVPEPFGGCVLHEVGVHMRDAGSDFCAGWEVFQVSCLF